MQRGERGAVFNIKLQTHPNSRQRRGRRGAELHSSNPRSAASLAPTPPHPPTQDVTCPDLEIEKSEKASLPCILGHGHNSNQPPNYTPRAGCSRHDSDGAEGGRGAAERAAARWLGCEPEPCFEDYFLSKPRSAGERRRHG